jgi:hypothetical protein
VGSLELHHVGFSRSPSIGVRKAGFQIQQEGRTIGKAKKGDGKIAANVEVIGSISEETHETS